jgi:glucose-1-phosphate cytidylyltransferase
MKAVILAGGRGTRIAEESNSRPKPMVEIGGRPILWHIMNHYAFHGIREFFVCLGYKGHMIKEYFANYCLYRSDVTVDLGANTIEYHGMRAEPWRVTLIDTGEATLTGGRLLRLRRYLEAESAFCLTYGDGLSDVDVSEEIRFHRRHGRWATMTVVRPPGRFGATTLAGDSVASFQEKPSTGEGFINGGFFVMSPRVFPLIDGDQTPLETTAMERLVAAGQLAAWRHEGFWQPMDTLRDKEQLEQLWEKPDCPWRLPARAAALEPEAVCA